MVADFMSKPLQGSRFKENHDLIMGPLPMKKISVVLTLEWVKESAQESNPVHKSIGVHWEMLVWSAQCAHSYT